MWRWMILLNVAMLSFLPEGMRRGIFVDVFARGGRRWDEVFI